MSTRDVLAFSMIVMISTLEIASGLEKNTCGPATELSLFDWPSISKLLERPRCPCEASAIFYRASPGFRPPAGRTACWAIFLASLRACVRRRRWPAEKVGRAAGYGTS